MDTKVIHLAPAGAWVAALTVIALGLRLTLLPTRLIVENDGPYYVALAAQLLRGEWSRALNDYWTGVTDQIAKGTPDSWTVVRW